MTISDTITSSTTLLHRYRHTRDETEALAAPLSAEDQVVQSMPDVSPTKWHRAHVTWFFETFLLLPHLPGYEVVDPSYTYLFNSYYEAIGERHPRPKRGMITRPSVDEVTAYRRSVDEAMTTLLEQVVPGRPDLVELVELGLHHEQQHQELLLMDIKHVLSVNPLRPIYRPDYVSVPTTPSPQEWVDIDGGIVTIGHAGDGFHFDNETPRHDVLVQPFRLADRPVTCGEWLDFMMDGGYESPSLWLSDGWHTVLAHRWNAPSYWHRLDDEWRVHTLVGDHPVDRAEPVVHVSYYEADAFARWAGRRLPTEFEWERAAEGLAVEGNLLPSSALHPRPAPAAPGLRQMFGDVWEWTASAYAAYPGFRAADTAVGEYNGKFMIDQQVLRGGAAVTPGGHVRATYRNFFPSGTRWMFAGLRLADDR